MQTALHRTGHGLAALLLLAASVLAVLPAGASAGSSPPAVCATSCPMMAGGVMEGMSCHLGDGAGAACCNASDDLPASPLDGVIPVSSPDLDAPAPAASASGPATRPAGATVPITAGPPLPAGPDLFLLHSSFLS